MKSTEKQELKRQIKRIGLFLLIVLVPSLVVAVLLIWAKVPMWANILVLVVMLLILYFFYLWVFSKIDNKKKERLKKKKDPFAE